MISQDAFDAMVLENMEDFELQKAEGLAETISQLKTMGKDLSHIDITGGEGREELLELIKCLKVLSSSSSEESSIALLCNLATICQDKHPLGLRNQNMMRTNGGLSALISAINASFHPSVLKQVFNLIAILCKSNGISLLLCFALSLTFFHKCSMCFLFQLTTEIVSNHGAMKN